MAKKLNSCFLIQYADDSQIILSGKVEDLEDLKSRAEIVLKEAKTYFQVNGLNINESKTQCLIVGSRQLVLLVPSDFEIKFGNIVIKTFLLGKKFRHSHGPIYAIRHSC